MLCLQGEDARPSVPLPFPVTPHDYGSGREGESRLSHGLVTGVTGQPLDRDIACSQARGGMTTNDNARTCNNLQQRNGRGLRRLRWLVTIYNMLLTS